MSQCHRIPALDETQLTAYWREGYLVWPGWSSRRPASRWSLPIQPNWMMIGKHKDGRGERSTL